MPRNSMPFGWLGFVLLASTGTLNGCAGMGGANPPSLESTHWRAEEITGWQVPDNALSTIEFTTGEGKVNGNAGCNLFFGTVELNGDSLKFGPLGATMRSCGEDLDGQETRYLRALEQTRSYTMSGSSLLLHDETGTTVLRFSQITAIQ